MQYITKFVFASRWDRWKFLIVLCVNNLFSVLDKSTHYVYTEKNIELQQNLYFHYLLNCHFPLSLKY